MVVPVNGLVVGFEEVRLRVCELLYCRLHLLVWRAFLLFLVWWFVVIMRRYGIEIVAYECDLACDCAFILYVKCLGDGGEAKGVYVKVGEVVSYEGISAFELSNVPKGYC